MTENSDQSYKCSKTVYDEGTLENFSVNTIVILD